MKQAAFVCLIFLSSLVAGDPQHYLECGDDHVDPSRQKCCQSTVTNFQGMAHPVCCGQAVFEKTNGRCCKGTVNSVTGMVHPKCCSSQIHDMAVSRCCDGVIYDPTTHQCQDDLSVAALEADISLDNAYEECGTKAKPYLPTTQKCCGNAVRDIPSGLAYPKCCGNTLIDLATSFCCGRQPVSLEDFTHPGCCGGVPFDRAWQICCGNAIKDARNKLLPKCCGSTTYDAWTYDCDDPEQEVVTAKADKCPTGWLKATSVCYFGPHKLEDALDLDGARQACQQLSDDKWSVQLLQLGDTEEVNSVYPDSNNLDYRLDAIYSEEAGGWVDQSGQRLELTGNKLVQADGSAYDEQRQNGYTLTWNSDTKVISGKFASTTPLLYMCTTPSL